MELMSAGARGLVLVTLFVFIAVCLLLCTFTGLEQDDAVDFYTGSRSLRPWQNGMAITGDYISALTVLGTTGIIALTGADGILLTCSTVIALAVLMMLLAEPLRAAGRYTVGDALAARFPSRGLRVAVTVVTLAVCLPYLVLQLTGVGTILALLLGLHGDGSRATCISMIGVLMVSFASTGGMRGTGRIQILKLFVLTSTAAVLAGWVLLRFHADPSGLLTAARTGSGHPDGFLRPGMQYGHTLTGSLDLFSVQFTGVLAAAGLPHITMRLYTAPPRAPCDPRCAAPSGSPRASACSSSSSAWASRPWSATGRCAPSTPVAPPASCNSPAPWTAAARCWPRSPAPCSSPRWPPSPGSPWPRHPASPTTCTPTPSAEDR